MTIFNMLNGAGPLMEGDAGGATGDPAPNSGDQGGSPPNTGDQSGGDNAEFLATLPEDIRLDPSFKDIGNVGDLAKSYVNAQKMIGAVGTDKMPRPNDNWEQSQWDDFYNSLGRPDTVKGYKVPEIENFQFKEGFADGVLPELHKLGLTQPQQEGVMRLAAGIVQQDAAATEAQNQKDYEACMEALTKTFGQTLPVAMQRAQRAVMYAGGQELWDAVQAANLDNNAGFIQGMAKIGKLVSEDAPLDGDDQVNGKTPAEAEAEMGQLKLDNEFMKAWKTRTHPGHKDAVERWNKLSAARYAGLDKVASAS